MSDNRWKNCVAFVVVGAVFVASGLAVAITLVARFFADSDRSWPDLFVPDVEQWPEIPLSIDPTLRCPSPVICRGSSHLGPRQVAPYEPCCDWQFDVTLTKSGERRVHMSSGDQGYGEAFDFVLDPSQGADRMHVFGRAFAEYQGEKPLQGLSGVVTLNTLEWREREPVHVHFELSYFYDGDADQWSRIEVCADAPATLEK